MSGTVHAFEYLDKPAGYPPPAVCVVFGDEPFLKRLAIGHLRRAVLGEDDSPFATFSGGGVEWRDVLDELSTMALFGSGGRRLAVVDEADKFVTDYREKLENYLAKPRSGGVLLLDVETWAANTRLYKLVDQQGLQIECRAPQRAAGKRKVPDEAALQKWLIGWAKKQHQLKLLPPAAKLLVDLLGAEFGRLDQELAKLALYAGLNGTATPEMVRDYVGGWKTKTVWDLVDLACEGNAAEALRQLDQLLHGGEEPIGVFAQMAWSLRRYAAATRIYERSERQGPRMALSQAVQQAGFPSWNRQALAEGETRLKQLGRERAGRLYRWLLDADLALKGTHSSSDRARFVLEQLILRLAKVPERAPAKGGRT